MLKDAHATAGMRTTTGFPPLADYVPQEDSTVAARLKAASGILLGKTNVPVMLADYQSNNPGNSEHTPGGSSGGAAVALASGMTSFEIGTDLAASIRIPAHFCDVFGLKPTEQRVPLTGLRVAFAPTFPGLPVAAEIRAAVEEVARQLSPLCRVVEEATLPALDFNNESRLLAIAKALSEVTGGFRRPPGY
jgi:amidase